MQTKFKNYTFPRTKSKWKALIILMALFSLLQCIGTKSEVYSLEDFVGKDGKFKIEVIQKNSNKTVIVTFRLCKKMNDQWKIIQTGSFEKDNFSLNLDTSEDLNNDGYNDAKISFAAAGRGSNSLEKLLIFDSEKEQLKEIKNSQEYPNLHYNPTRDCINSYAFSGGNTTYFLKIENDHLTETAHVYYANDTAKVYRKINGENLLILKKFYDSDNNAAVFFSDYDPLEE